MQNVSRSHAGVSDELLHFPETPLGNDGGILFPMSSIEQFQRERQSGFVARGANRVCLAYERGRVRTRFLESRAKVLESGFRSALPRIRTGSRPLRSRTGSHQPARPRIRPATSARKCSASSGGRRLRTTARNSESSPTSA